MWGEYYNCATRWSMLSILYLLRTSLVTAWTVPSGMRHLPPSTLLRATTELSHGALSMSLEELGHALGGMGRARIAWDCYLLGVDPAMVFGDDDDDATAQLLLHMDESITTTSNDNNNKESIDITHHLPTSRKTQRLGADALQRLAHVNRSYGAAQRVDGGLATLLHVTSSARDRTTKFLLQMADGTQVETVIIPFGADIAIDNRYGYDTVNEDCRESQNKQAHNGDSKPAKEKRVHLPRSTICISSQVGCRQGKHSIAQDMELSVCQCMYILLSLAFSSFMKS
jgi:hypothetical protein